MTHLSGWKKGRAADAWLMDQGQPYYPYRLLRAARVQNIVTLAGEIPAAHHNFSAFVLTPSLRSMSAWRLSISLVKPFRLDFRLDPIESDWTSLYLSLRMNPSVERAVPVEAASLLLESCQSHKH